MNADVLHLSTSDRCEICHQRKRTQRIFLDDDGWLTDDGQFFISRAVWVCDECEGRSRCAGDDCPFCNPPEAAA
jgi:hypothetical protein